MFSLAAGCAQRWAKEDEKTVMFMALKRMTKYCRFCGEGKWGCVCRRDEDGWVIEEDHWHPAMPPEEEERGKRKRKKKKKKDKKKKQNEGLQSPAEKTLEEKDASPEINKIAAPPSSKTAGRRALFAK